MSGDRWKTEKGRGGGDAEYPTTSAMSEVSVKQAEILLEGSIQRQLRNNDQMTDDLAAAIAPMTFRQRMDASVKQAEILLDASRKMLAAAEAMLASVNAAIDELK